jgi:hypothetical protein
VDVAVDAVVRYIEKKLAREHIGRSLVRQCSV